MKDANTDRAGILFIAYYFPPLQSIGVWRNYFLAREAKKYFSYVFVSTSERNKHFDPGAGTYEDFIKIENLTFDYRSFFGKKSQTGFKETVKKNFFSRTFIKLINSFPFNILIGEGGLLYIVHSLFQLNRLVRKNRINYMYSSYRPMSDHFIAYMLKTFHPDLRWTADFRDLPFDPLYKSFYCLPFQKWALRKILNKADLVTSFTEGVTIGLSDFTTKTPHVLRNGFFDQFTPEPTIGENPKFTIQYTGSLFLDERDPSPLFKSISELLSASMIDKKKFALRYAGKDAVLWTEMTDKYCLSEIAETTGMVSNAVARQMQEASHINLILTSSHSNYRGILTGKFFEYVLAGKPIICVVKGETDKGLEEIFSTYHLGLVIYNDSESLKRLEQFILDLYRQYRLFGKTEWQINPKIFEDFSWKSSFHTWLKILEDDKNS